MTEEMESILCELISAAGAARSCYIRAIQAAKTGESDVSAMIQEGDQYYMQAHDYHHSLLSMEGEGKTVPVTFLTVHVEDQMMSAETFRILSQELVDLYRFKNH